MIILKFLRYCSLLTIVLDPVSLCWALWRSRTGFRKTDSLIYRLIRSAIQTGLFVSIFALGDMFAFHFASSTNIYATFAFPIGRIYSNVSKLTSSSLDRPDSLSSKDSARHPSFPSPHEYYAHRRYPRCRGEYITPTTKSTSSSHRMSRWHHSTPARAPNLSPF